MSIGNLKDQGNKGNNFPYQLRNLQLLGDIAASVVTIPGLATEATLLQVLTALQNGQEYEAMLVVDAANVTWLEVRIWNTDTHTFDPPIYYLVGSNTPGTPVAPISYINPNTYLAQIVSNTTGLATQTTLALLEGKDFATQTTLSSVNSYLSQVVTNTLATANNVESKINRIKGAANYSRALTYDGTGTQNVTVIVHTGTTALGAETITETFTYVDPTINGSNITNIVYS